VAGMSNRQDVQKLTKHPKVGETSRNGRCIQKWTRYPEMDETPRKEWYVKNHTGRPDLVETFRSDDVYGMLVQWVGCQQTYETSKC
jgi:hypothetical protein